ncbi:MAG: LarC family nickel insertion protein [Gemmatimonadota bacterium]
MSHGRFAIIDPVSGISGDMLLGALVAAGAPQAWLESLPRRLGVPHALVRMAPVTRCGIACLKVTVELPGGDTELPNESWDDQSKGRTGEGGGHPGDDHHHDHLYHDHEHHDAHGHHHGATKVEPHDHAHPHRHLGELLGLIATAEISERTRELATRAFRLLAEAEGAIHGMPAESVALHEVGAVDALIDIVGGIEGFEQLGIDRVYARPVALGSGWIRAAHGVMPVPAPVTARLAEGLEIGPNGPVTGEATTPTGAVLLRVLSAGAHPLRWRPVASGWGAGGRDPHSYPNALRLIIAEGASEAAQVTMLATDLDDLSPEYIEPLREALLEAGALDVQIWGTQMKKGRAGFRLEVTTSPDSAERVAGALFLHSTTAGVRRWSADRITLRRRQIEVDAGQGHLVRVKILDAPDGPRAKPEYDDIRAAARRLGRPAHEVAREVQQRALALVTGPAGAGPQTPNEEP